jgi:hypothetical protein
VVKSATFVLLVCLAAGEVLAQPVAPVLSVWAVQAKVEGNKEVKTFDPKLAPVRRALENLPFDTFTCLGDFGQAVPESHEVSVPVSARYTLYLKPRERLADGRLLLEFRIEMPSRELRGKPVVPLKAEVKLIPGDLLNVRGCHLEEGGELILVLRVDFPAR